jgi:hypothetical protein
VVVGAAVVVVAEAACQELSVIVSSVAEPALTGTGVPTRVFWEMVIREGQDSYAAKTKPTGAFSMRLPCSTLSYAPQRMYIPRLVRFRRVLPLTVTFQAYGREMPAIASSTVLFAMTT